MGNYQKFRLENNEQKLFYIIDDLYAGMNTEFSDDSASDNEFEKMLNFDLSSTGSLEKRYGWGKSKALSQIMQLFENYPSTYLDKGNKPENINNNICYMKIIKNDNRCFNALLDMDDYTEYQQEFGALHNTFKILMITDRHSKSTSDGWLFTVTLTEYNSPLIINLKTFELPLKVSNSLLNIDTIEFYNKIYFVGSNNGLFVFDIDSEEFDYKFSYTNTPNSCYKPNALEVRKVGFNVLCDDPLHDINYQGIVTNSIQGIYLTTMDNIPVLKIPNDGKFRLNILHTGSNTNFDIKFTTGTNDITFTKTKNNSLSSSNVTVYDIVFETSPTGETEIKIEKVGSELEPYYDYYDIGSVDSEAKAITKLDLGGCGITEMYNRAVYYKDDTIWFSDINIFDYVPNYNYITLPLSSTDKITKIVYFKNIYVVFTEQTIYKLSGAFGDANFSVEPINLTIGCPAPQTIVHIDNELFFLSSVGLYSLVSSAYREDTENLKEIDLKIKTLTMGGDIRNSSSVKYIDKFKGIQSYASAIRYKDKYMLFTNNKATDKTYVTSQNYDVIVYNTSLKAFNVLNYKAKPQFIFPFEGKLLTYCLFADEKEYDVGEDLIEYDAEEPTNTTIDNKVLIVDQTENNLDAVLNGNNSIINEVIGTSLNGINNKIILPSRTQNLAQDLKISTRFKTLDDVCPICYLGKSSIYTDPETQRKKGSLVINATMGYKFTLDYDIVADLQAYLQSGQHKANITYKLSCSYTTSVKDVVINATIRTNAGNIGVHNNINAVKGTLATGSGQITINDDLSINDTIQIEIRGTYKVPISVISDPESGTREGTAYQYYGSNRPYEYYNKIYYTTVPAQNKTKLTKFDWRVSDVLQHIYYPYGWTMTTNVVIDYSKDNVNWTNIYNQTVYNGVIDFRNVRDYTGTVNLNNVFAEHSNSGVCYIRAYIVNSLDGGSAPPQGTFNTIASTQLPIITSHTEYETKSFVNQAGSTVVTDALIGTSREIFYVDYLRDEDILVIGTYEGDVDHRRLIPLNKKYEDFVDFNLYITGPNKDIVVTMNNDRYEYLNSNIILNNADRDNCFLGYNPDHETKFRGIISNFTLATRTNQNIPGYDNNIYDYAMTEGSGTVLNHISGVVSWAATLNGSWLLKKAIKFMGAVTDYAQIPVLQDNHRFANGFKIDIDFKIDNISDSGNILELSNAGMCPIVVRKVANESKIEFLTTSANLYEGKINYTDTDIYQRHLWTFSCVKISGTSGYRMSIEKDGVLVKSVDFDNEIVTNIKRDTNRLMRIGGSLYNFNITIYASSTIEDVYRPCLFENYKDYTDFNEPIEIELITKGINLKYPMHIKKLKNIYVKGIGGFAYDEFIFELFNDGHLVNDSKKYYVQIGENGEIIYDYNVEKALSFDEAIATLGNFRLDKTRLGESSYQTKKIIIPAKGKNFYIHLKGESSQYLSVESIGFVFKLGKVKQD